MIARPVVGDRLGSVSFRVELGKVRELARALHDDVDDEPQVPLTATVLSAHWQPGGAVATALELGLDLERLLHGETTWEYLAPVEIGDWLHGETTVTDVAERSGKRGGRMTLVTVCTDFTNQHGEVAIRRSDVLIEREAS